MKLSVALFFAGFFGALGVLFFLLSFGTDYWLLASETCSQADLGTPGPGGAQVEYRTSSEPVLFPSQRGDVSPGVPSDEDSVHFYHEGFFWRCRFGGRDGDDTFLKFWITNQSPSKLCVHSYLYPFPVTDQTYNVTDYQMAIIYRGFWSVFMLVGVVAAVAGGFFIICAAPFASYRLYKAGGGLFLTAGLFFLAVIVMFVIWLQVLDVLDRYLEHQRGLCSGFQLSVHYGLSFMFAPVGVFFSLLAGLLFLLIGRSVQMQYH